MDLYIKYKTERREKEGFDRVVELYKLGRTFIAPTARFWSPNIDIYSIDDNLYVKVDIAGVSIDDIKVSFNDGVLVISGKRLDADTRRKKRYYQVEIDYGRFVRKIRFPFELDAESAEAEYEDGFLRVRFRIITDKERKIKLR